MGLSQARTKKTAENAAAEEDVKCMASEAVWEGENQMRGHQQ